jgi:hypothetical protein
VPSAYTDLLELLYGEIEYPGYQVRDFGDRAASDAFKYFSRKLQFALVKLIEVHGR